MRPSMTASMPYARSVIVCVDRFDAKGGLVWAVRTGRQWLAAREVRIEIPMVTVFRGAAARQPKAYLEGIGIVRDDGAGVLTIVPAART